MLARYWTRRERIARHLAEQGATVADLARERQVSPATVYRWLSPNQTVSHATRQRLLASALLTGLTFQDIFEAEPRDDGG